MIMMECGHIVNSVSVINGEKNLIVLFADVLRSKITSQF